MKKLFIAVVLLFGGSTVISAQCPPRCPPPPGIPSAPSRPLEGPCMPPCSPCHTGIPTPVPVPHGQRHNGPLGIRPFHAPPPQTPHCHGPGTPCGPPVPCEAPNMPCSGPSNSCGPCMPPSCPQPCLRIACPRPCPPQPCCEKPCAVVCAVPKVCCKQPCHSEFYVGAIGYGINLNVGHHGIGVDEYFGNGQCDDDLSDSLWGAIIGYTYRKPCGFYFNTEFDWACGDLCKERKYIEDIPGRFLHYYLGFARAGYNFLFCDRFVFTPYGGVGYRFVRHNFRHDDLHLNYRNWFGLAGARIDWLASRCFSIGIDAQWIIPFHSSIQLKHFSGSIDTDHRDGVQVELPMKFIIPCFCNSFSITLSPFFRRIVDGKSRELTCDIETIRIPQLTNEEYGARLYFGYLF